MTEDIDRLIANAREHSEILRSMIDVMTEYKDKEDTDKVDDGVAAMRFANRTVLNHIRNLEYVKDKVEAAKAKASE
jgi:hypothetical protein